MTTLPIAPGFLSAHRPPLETALRLALTGQAEPITAAARYVMGWEDASGRPTDRGGKRLRPLLCLFAAESLGGAIDLAMPAAVAVELVHNFSLVHDDVQDGDKERHGRPAAWALHGAAQAINLGDYLHTAAVRALVDGPGPVDSRAAALSVLLEATAQMIEGQWADISFEARSVVAVEDYLAMTAGKTGALLGAPLEMGAIMAGAPRDRAAALGRWGRQIGIAFQAHDDYLGIWGDPAITGKSNANDIIRKKKTLPVVLALQDQAAAAVITAAYSNEVVPTSAVRDITAAIEATGSDVTCRALAAHYVALADGLLNGIFPDAVTRARFRQVADYLVSRSA